MKKGWLKSYAQDGKKVAALSPEDAAIATVLMERNRGKNFVDRAFNNETAPRLQTNTIPGYETVSPQMYSTELMAYDVNPDGTARVYPEIVQKPGEKNLTYLGGDRAWNYADSTREYITTPNAKIADMLSDKGYKKAAGIPTYAGGGMIKRADGSYSKRGLWDNIRANTGSGKKPTKEMLKQEKKIRAAEKAKDGAYVDGVYNPAAGTIDKLAAITPQQLQMMQMQKNQEQSTIKEAAPRRSTAEKRGAIARNPVTAAQYMLQGKPIPDYFEKGDRNIYENVVDVINPMTYYDAAKNVLGGKHFKDASTAGQMAMAVPLTLLDAAQFVPGGSAEKTVAKAIQKEAPALKKAASHVVDREASLLHFPDHNKNYILKDGFNIKDLEPDRVHVGIVRGQKIKIKRTGNSAKVEMVDPKSEMLPPSERHVFNFDVEDLHKKHPKIEDLTLFGNNADAASHQVNNLIDFLPQAHIQGEASLSNYSTPLQNLKIARFAKDKGRVKIKPTGKMVPDNYIYKSGYNEELGRVQELKTQFPKLQKSYDVLSDATGIKFKPVELRIANPGVKSNQITYENSVPATLDDVTPENIIRARAFRPDYESWKNYKNGGILPYYPIAEDGFSTSDAALIRQAVANQKSVPYQDMDPAMLKQYQLMQELSTAAGRARAAKEKAATASKSKDKETKQYMMEKAAQKRAAEDPSMFSPSFWKEDPMTGRRATDRLYDMGTDIDTRVAPKFGNFVDYLNPGNYAADVAKGILQAPLKSTQENSIMPYVQAAAEPILMAGANKYILGPLLEKGIQKASPYIGKAIMNIKSFGRNKNTSNPIQPVSNEFQESLQQYFNENNLSTEPIDPNLQQNFSLYGREALLGEIADDLESRGHRNAYRTAREYIDQHSIPDEHGELGNASQIIEHYRQSNAAEQLVQNQDPMDRSDALRLIQQNLASAGHRNARSISFDHIQRMESQGMTPQEIVDDFVNNNVAQEYVAQQKPEYSDLPSDHKKSILDLDFNQSDKYRYNAANKAGKVTIAKRDNVYDINMDAREPNNYQRKNLHFTAEDLGDGYPNLDNFSFFNESPINAGKQLDEAFRLVGPKAQMQERGSTSIYSTPLWYNRLSKFMKEAKPELDALTPNGKRIDITSVRNEPMNGIVKNIRNADGKKISSFQQAKEQLPHIQKSIEQLEKLSDTKLPGIEIKYQGNPISVEEFMKLDENSIPNLSSKFEILVPDFKFKKHYKQGGKITNNWLQNY